MLGQIPNEPNALHTLGVLAHQAGQNEFAADLFRRATDLAPMDAEFHDHLGMAQAALGRWEEAAASLGRAMELEPGPETCLNLAHALRRLGRSQDATARYQQAIELQPDFHSAHNNLGILLREQGRLAMKCPNCITISARHCVRAETYPPQSRRMNAPCRCVPTTRTRIGIWL